MTYNVTLPRHSKIGAGSSDELGALCVELGIDRLILVTDRYLSETGQAERLTNILASAGCVPAGLLRHRA